MTFRDKSLPPAKPKKTKVEDPGDSIRRLTTREIGAIKGGRHVKCRCCGTINTIDMDGAEESMWRRLEANFNTKACRHARHFLARAWKVGVTEVDPSVKERVSTPSIPQIYNTGVGHALRRVYLDALHKGHAQWFAIAWQDVPVFSENLFVVPLGMLFTVLRALADDSADFAARLQQVVDTAHKRDWSAAAYHVGPLDTHGSGDGGQDGGRAFDPGSAVDA